MSTVRDGLTVDPDEPPIRDDTDPVEELAAPPRNKGGRPPGARDRKPRVRNRSTATAGAAPKRPAPRATPLQQRLETALASIGMGVYMFESYDGTVIVNGAPGLAKALADLAKVNPTVKRVLETAMTGGEMGAVIMATLAIALPICAHHGLIPSSFVPPGVAPAPPPAPPGGDIPDAFGAGDVVGRVA